jgi:class 3 adenylate cyclase
LINDENKKQLVQQQMQYDFDKKEAATKAEQDKKDAVAQEEAKRQRNIRNSSFAGFGGLLLFSLVVVRQRNKVKKEKQRSDELLLNILPAETAEELKATGTTKAKDFDEVTVLFTDFKNFTAMSEQLSAQELVNEINYCYSAFDHIISKYGIEKIKTIGDSYMCAGGLPVPNKTNAEDAVKTALEIRDFMLSEKQRREAEGKTFFEIRIGLHTGPVVAGIVGIKKFAYDLWGDTVNIASRMESSGEEGKVNISGGTYELVKEKFNCSHRGKIQAKNKGQIDMYFVE